MNIGAHVSIRGGFTKAFDEIREIGGTCGYVYVMEIDGGNEINLTNNPANDMDPT